MTDPTICEIPRWQQLKRQLNNLTPAEFKAALAETPDVVLIDVRTPAEFEAGHIPGAVNINYLAYDFWDTLERLDPQRTYFIYCRTSRRSVRTCTLMRNGGFKKIYHLDGGWNLWSETFGDGGIR
jgi:rhodanese-related sulfurtransferase